MFTQFTIHECNSNYNNNSFEFLETKTNRRSTATTPLYSDDSDMNTTDRSIANRKRINFNQSVSPTKDKHNSNNNANSSNNNNNNNYMMMITTSQPVCRKLNFYEDDTMDMNGVTHSSSTNTCNNVYI